MKNKETALIIAAVLLLPPICFGVLFKILGSSFADGFIFLGLVELFLSIISLFVYFVFWLAKLFLEYTKKYDK